MSIPLESFADRPLGRAEQAIEGELLDRPLLPRPVERAVTVAVAKQWGRGEVGRARVVTTGRVARVAFVYLDRLEADETAAAARDPINAGHRQRRLVDAFAAVAEDAILTTGRAFRC